MTFSSADLLEVLRQRARSLRPEVQPGEFPPQWKAWFASMHERIGAITGASADAVIAIFVAREPKPAPRATIALNRWSAFNTLWRQQWHPASEDERGTRIAAIVVTLLVHLFFAVFLLYLAYVRFMGLPPEPRAGEEDVIQVEFIGEGTPQDQGGGAAQGEVRPDRATPPAATSPAPSPPAAAPPPAPAQQASAPTSQAQPQTPAQPVDQPLQVTETPVPDQTFTLPPQRTVNIRQPQPPMPELRTPSPEVRIVEIPAPVQAPTPRNVPSATLQAPDLTQRPAAVTIREVPTPLPPAPIREIAPRSLPVPELRSNAPAVAERAIPTPPGPPATAATTPSAPSSAPAASAAQPATPASASSPAAAGTKTATRSGTQPMLPGAGSGTAPSPKPGAVPSSRRGDDWGVSGRNQPGGQAGTPGALFNADGSPKLVGDGKVGGGLPPGTITEDFAKIDRNGTWLKRPSSDYTPTSFDKLWVPNETLLQEWVRKSIKEVLIPIPGTSKRIKCSIVVLALGGSCSVDDPNLQDVEADARKAPEIPFKRELQEDQKSLAPPANVP